MADKIIKGSLEVTDQIIHDGIDISKNLSEVTWANLKSLRDNSQLVPGRFYRITDYTCTTIQANTSSAGHVFDIIVRADSINKLNEEASAILHDGDTYFSGCKLEAWKLWYCLDNDTNKFVWADSTNGTGVIYRMIDEFGNDCPYDFKNILFTTSGKYTNAYTFSYTEDSTIKDASILAISKKCYGNIVKEHINSSNKLQLNFNVFYSTWSTFNCYCNTFENTCWSNTFGSGCYNNIFGNECSYNTFGSFCHSHIFGNDCYSNTFGNNCRYNIFGNNCNHNTFVNECATNTFGNRCEYNIFGTSYYYNTFGDGCKYNTFGTSSSTINNGEYIIIDNGCKYLYITSQDSGSVGYLQNIHIHLGVTGTSSNNRKTITVNRNLDYETNIVPARTTTIEV